MIGATRRLRRIMGADERMLLIPVDHAVTSGPVGGLRDIESTIGQLAAGEPDAIIAHRGLLSSISPTVFRDVPVILHVSGQSTLSGREHLKVTVGSAEDAIRLGAEAMSVHVTLGTEDDAQGLRDLGAAATAALGYGLPLLAMMQVKGEPGATELAHATRIAAELGASIVKVTDPGTPAGIEEILSGSYVPVVIAGGAVRGADAILESAKRAVEAGASGVCVGRNAFESPSPRATVSALRAVIHEGASVEGAAKLAAEPVVV